MSLKRDATEVEKFAIEMFMRKNFHLFAMIESARKLASLGLELQSERQLKMLFERVESEMLSAFREEPDLLDSGLQFLETLRFVSDERSEGKSSSH